MRQTKNFAFNLPDPTDMMNVEDLNENFETIDEEIEGYTLDLREFVTWDRVNERTPNTFDLNEFSENIDLNALFTAVKEGRKVKLQFKTLEQGLLIEVENDVTIILKTLRVSDGSLYQLSDSFPDMFMPIPRYGVVLGMEDREEGLYASLMFGYYDLNADNDTEEPAATNVSVVKAEGTVTITATLEGGGTSVTTIEIDENDVPTKITTDGVECPISWEGF